MEFVSWHFKNSISTICRWIPTELMQGSSPRTFTNDDIFPVSVAAAISVLRPANSHRPTHIIVPAQRQLTDKLKNNKKLSVKCVINDMNTSLHVVKSLDWCF